MSNQGRNKNWHHQPRQVERPANAERIANKDRIAIFASR